jgi:hypothetical protein
MMYSFQMRYNPLGIIPVAVLLTAMAATSIAQTAGPGMPATDLTAIQDAINQLIVAVNNRDAKAVHAVTIPSFDARAEGIWLNRNGAPQFGRSTTSYEGVEVAALVRGARLITIDVALAEGFFRTIKWPGGTDAAGALAVTLVKRDGRWLAAAARFGAYRFSDKSTFMVMPADRHAVAGEDGWIRLFDGKSLDAFTGPGDEPVSGCWKGENGLLTINPASGEPNRGIRTKDTFRSFELRFDWKVPPKGNSGVKYRLFYLVRGDAGGHEYQLADDAGDPGAIQHAAERSGALYNQIAPSKSAVKPAGEWNSSAIIVRGRHCEHWLNGEKVVEYETNSGPIESPLVFQNHQTQAWFRDVIIRRLD